jgi:hypothetical protein
MSDFVAQLSNEKALFFQKIMLKFWSHLHAQFVLAILHQKHIRMLKDGVTTLSIMTFSIKTFSIKTFSIKTFSIKTFSIKTFSIKTFSIKTFSTNTFSIKHSS